MHKVYSLGLKMSQWKVFNSPFILRIKQGSAVLQQQLPDLLNEQLDEMQHPQ